jgi:hypothetical protein
LPAGANAQQIASSVQQVRFAISTTTPITLVLNQLYFPGWAATGGALAPQPITGLMTLAVPAGDNQRITLTYTGTPLERAAGWLSLLAWLCLIGVLAWLGLSTLTQRRQGAETAANAAPRQVWRHPSSPIPGVLPLLTAVAIVATILAVRAAAPGWFRYASPPGTVASAQQRVQAVFDGVIRVVGVDLPATPVQPGAQIQTSVYLETVQPMQQDHGLFLHLDRADGVTVAAVDVLHPDEIPMRTWPAGFYVRAPLHLRIPPDALPIRYALKLGVPDPANERWLPLANGENLLNLGYVWVEPAATTPDGPPIARFGDNIALLQAAMAMDGALHLRWRADAPISDNLTIFVHYLDKAGQLLGQADGAPYDNLYPPDAWLPGQAVEDVRALPDGIDPAQVATVRVGVYDAVTAARLPGEADGAMLPDGSYELKP